MKKAFVVHGWGGGPETDWLPWLKSELEKRGYEIYVPEMPDTEVPVIEKWVSHLGSVVGTSDADTYFVGHSIGCQTILRYLETIDTKIGGAIFVSGWFDLENMESKEEETTAKPWIETPINLDKVKRVLPHSTLIISDNDPYGAFELNKRKFEELGSKIIIMNKAGHMTGDDGYIQLPEIVRELELF